MRDNPIINSKQPRSRLQTVLDYWNNLPTARRNDIVSFFCSFNICFGLLLVLATITITVDFSTSQSIILSTEGTSLENDSYEFDLSSVSEVSLDAPSELEPIPAMLASASEFSTLNTPESTSAILQGSTGSNLAGLSGSDQALVADMNRRVGQAGGILTGPIRVSLSFPGEDDLDLHISFDVPNTSRRKRDRSGNTSKRRPVHVYYGNKQTEYAELDVDANGSVRMLEPCENIIFLKKPPLTRYTIHLDNYAERDTPDDTPYVIVVQYGGNVEVFQGTLKPDDRMIEICSFRF